MSRKRLLLLAGAALSLLLLEAVLIVALLPRPPEGPAARIKPGMTLPEAEAILGPAPDLPAPAGSAKRVRIWLTPQGPVPVEFDDGDRVSERAVLKGRPPPDSMPSAAGSGGD
jgi:hypothetical protein